MSDLDVARFLIASLGGALIGLSLLVGALNLRMRWNTPRRALAIHIFLLGFSYAVLAGAAAFEMARVLGSPLTWRVFVHPVAYLTGFVGLRYLWRDRRDEWTEGSGYFEDEGGG